MARCSISMKSRFAKSLADLKARFALLYAWENDRTSGMRVHVRFLALPFIFLCFPASSLCMLVIM